MVGVFGRELSRFVGEAGLDSVRGRASFVSAALYFFVDGGMRLGVVEREGGVDEEAEAEADTDGAEGGRLPPPGVKGVGRAILLGVGKTDIAFCIPVILNNTG